jgi:hypothetical protein
MNDPYLPDLSDLTEAEAVELLELLERTNLDVGQALANVAMKAELADDGEVLAAQLASMVAHIEHVCGFERFDKLLRMCRAGYKASFPMGIRAGQQPKA